MTEYLGGIRRGTPIQEGSPDLLETPHDGGVSRGIIRDFFKGERGVTQENPLSPTIFNVVVDAVLRHCVRESLRTRKSGASW